MGNNSSKWDRDAQYRSLTLKQLEGKRDFWLGVLKRHDYPAARDELTYIRSLIADKIGKIRT